MERLSKSSHLNREATHFNSQVISTYKICAAFDEILFLSNPSMAFAKEIYTDYDFIISPNSTAEVI